MPVTEQQARALAFLAIAIRPHGAPRWDEAGVYANVMKVADRSLSTVTIAVVQAAEDRKAATPGVIPTAGPHWRDPESAPRAPHRAWNPQDFCECGQPLDAHTATSHEPVTSIALKRLRAEKPIDVHRAVQGLRDVKATDTPPERPEPETSDEGTRAVAPARAALAAAREEQA